MSKMKTKEILERINRKILEYEVRYQNWDKVQGFWQVSEKSTQEIYDFGRYSELRELKSEIEQG